jgi:hypothetical protein
MVNREAKFRISLDLALFQIQDLRSTIPYTYCVSTHPNIPSVISPNQTGAARVSHLMFLTFYRNSMG